MHLVGFIIRIYQIVEEFSQFPICLTDSPEEDCLSQKMLLEVMSQIIY